MADFAKGSTCSQCGTEIKRDVDGGDCWPASRPGYLRQVHENCVPGHLKKFPDDVIGPWYHPVSRFALLDHPHQLPYSCCDSPAPFTTELYPFVPQ